MNWKKSGHIILMFFFLLLPTVKHLYGCTAAFDVDNTTPVVGEPITFINQSTGGENRYNWNFGTNANPGMANTVGPHSVSYSSSGPKTVTLTVSWNGFGSNTATKTDYINVGPTPVPTAGNNGPICTGSTLSLTASSITGATYSWTGPNGFTSSSRNPTVSTSATTAMAGTYSVTATLYGYTSTAGTTTVTVYGNLTAGISGGTSPICYNTNPGTLTATGGGGNGSYTYLWYKDGSTTGVTTQTYNPGNLTASASFYCEVTSGSCGTVNTNTTSITVYQNFTSEAIESTGQTICYAGTPSLIGSATDASGGDNSITYQWRSSADGYTTPISGATSSSYTPPAGLTVTTSYQRYANDGTCNTSPTVSTGTWTVTVNPLPTVSIGDPLTAICQGKTTAALGGSFGGGATGAVWSDGSAGGTFANNDGTTPAATTYTASSTYSSPVTLTLTSSGGACGTASDSKNLTVNPTPVVSNYSAYSFCSGESANINLSAKPSSTFTWTIGTITGSVSGASDNSTPTTIINQQLSISNNATTGSVVYVVTPTSTTGSCVGAPFSITVTVEHPAIGSFE